MNVDWASAFQGRIAELRKQNEARIARDPPERDDLNLGWDHTKWTDGGKAYYDNYYRTSPYGRPPKPPGPIANALWCLAGSLALWLLWRIPISLIWIYSLNHLPAGDLPFAAYTADNIVNIVVAVSAPWTFLHSFTGVD